MALTCWAIMLSEAITEANDTEMISCTLLPTELLKSFDDGYGGTRGVPFTAWTENRVYFPVCYDGAEWVGSAPRNICEEHTPHMGGG